MQGPRSCFKGHWATVRGSLIPAGRLRLAVLGGPARQLYEIRHAKKTRLCNWLKCNNNQNAWEKVKGALICDTSNWHQLGRFAAFERRLIVVGAAAPRTLKPWVSDPVGLGRERGARLAQFN